MSTEETKTSVANGQSALKRFVMCEFTSYEMEKMTGRVPFAVQVRLKLNAHGFRFADDGKVSAVINENPEPLGKLTTWKDYKSGSVFYKQELDITTELRRSHEKRRY